MHLCGWVGFFLFLIFSDDDTEVTTMPLWLELIVLFCYFIPFISFFYLNSLYLIRKYLFTKRFKSYLFYFTLALLVLVIVECGFSYIDQLYFNKPEEGEAAFSWSVALFDNFFFTLLILGLSFSYSFLLLWNQSEKLKKESELKLLKSQMNPHFLFNSLNTLYSLISDREMEKAEDAVLKLSDLLRYSVYQANSSRITLGDEISYIENYIALQRLRLPQDVEINLEVKSPRSDSFIEPMLLIPFVENAFKHGISYRHQSSIDISISTEGQRLFFYIKNTIKESLDVEEEFSGVGIENVKSRLRLLYPNHSIKIETNQGIFSVALIIDNF